MTERETRQASTENNPNPPEIQLVKMKDIKPAKIKWSEATEYPIDVLLVVVNKIEFRAAYQILTEPKSADSETDLGKVYFGQIGKNNVALVRSSMGPRGNTGMERTCREGIKQLEAKTVISVGICFGMKDRKQKLGDVVVSTKFAPYESSRANRDGSLEFRGTITECNGRMTRLFEDGEAGWNSPVESDVHCGLMISGSKLVDDEDLKKRLQKQFPAALAGEMEGEGLKNACEYLDLEPHQRPPWIICKAISDWGDGTKNKEWQPCAAVTAASYVKHILEQYYVPGEEGNGSGQNKRPADQDKDEIDAGEKRQKTATKLKGSGQNKRPADQDEDEVDAGPIRRKTATKLEGQLKWLEIQDINVTVYEKLCRQLNKKSPGKDYKALAGDMNYSLDDIEDFALCTENPADALLRHWRTTRGNDVARLIQHLKNIGQDRLVEPLLWGF